MTLSLHIPQSRSLKDKRHVIKSILEGVRGRYNVSAAELDDLDSHQQATLGFAVVANDAAFAHKVLEAVRATVESRPEVVLCEVSVEML
ncbi:MAG: DUF503 family protein [Chthonomonadales bacterium]|nr:DUF503 family protein [Chthonomonadales bacterium]